MKYDSIIVNKKKSQRLLSNLALSNILLTVIFFLYFIKNMIYNI